MKRILNRLINYIELVRKAGEASVLARHGNVKEAKKLMVK